MNFIKVLFTPSCWMQLYSYSPTWDKQLNELMKTNKFVRVTDCTAKIGDILVWIENYPYASFHPQNPKIETRPKRSTILRAHENLISDFASNGELK